MSEPESPSLEALRQRAQAFVAARDWHRFHSPRNLAMALSVEAGELLELYLWSRDDGPQPDPESRRAAVASEAADVLLCLLNFASAANIDLAAALDAKLAVAERKYPVERVRGRALKYSEYAEYRPPEGEEE